MVECLEKANNPTFDPNPRFVNHMCHWKPWAKHFLEAEGDVGTLANMLGYSLEENDRLGRRLQHYMKAHSKLLWAFIALVETGKTQPFVSGDEKEQSVRDAWCSIQVLNGWREENKLNIRAVDVD